ncbi:MAG: nickel-dependent lactate racemase, partial [Firmicutes bacterium]|nr:nickel-dependent lactate racemase [Bacillota bacterium]
DTSALGDPPVLTGREPPVLADLAAAVRERIARPIGSATLLEEIRRRNARRVVVIVNDVTRPTPYDSILPPLLAEIEAAGVRKPDVTFVVATGIHRGMTEEEMKAILGSNVMAAHPVMNHDCDDTANLVHLGRLSHGSELYVNRVVLETDMVITTGVIAPHYFAGFSGGRKSILPGVAGRETISHNHSLMTSDFAEVCNIEENPVHQEMVEAARKVDVGFMVNVVVDAHGDAVGVVAGDIEQAWLEGVRMGREISVTHIDRLYDVAIASPGGYPKDINVYQAQKGLDNAARAVRSGGTVILVAECPEGYGEPTFEEWMEEAHSPGDIFARFAAGFELGGHKAYSLARVMRDREVVLVSGLGEAFTRKLFMTPAPSLDAAIDYVRAKHGPGFTSVILPHAGIVVPTLKS